MSQLSQTILPKLFESISWSADGLLTVVAQDEKSGEVLMVAWMNATALQKTIDAGEAHYWSRSRQCLWRKGETSGHTQRVREMRLDCDGDTLLLKVTQKGPACHTGNRSCFFQVLDNGVWRSEELSIGDYGDSKLAKLK